MKPVTLTLLAALLATPALADVVHLRDGRKVDGAVSVQKDGSVLVRQRWGEVAFARDEVERIQETNDAWDDLQRMRRELGEGTADERYRLGEWCRVQGFKREAQDAFLSVLRVDPDHLGARAALGYVLHEGRWVTLADKNRSLGLVEHEGAWITPEERSRRIEQRRETRERARQAELAARDAERERRKAEREEAAADRKERIRVAELELAKAREERAKAEAEAREANRYPSRFYASDGWYYPVGYLPYGSVRVLGGGRYYGGCYPYPVSGYGSGSYSGYGASTSGFYNGGNWGIRWRVGGFNVGF